MGFRRSVADKHPSVPSPPCPGEHGPQRSSLTNTPLSGEDS